MSSGGTGAGNAMTEKERAAYICGYKDGLEAYAIWKDGETTVGDPPKPLREAKRDLLDTWNFYPRTE